MAANGYGAAAFGNAGGLPQAQAAQAGVVETGLTVGSLTALGAVQTIGIRSTSTALVRAGTYALEALTPLGEGVLIGTIIVTAAELVGRASIAPVAPSSYNLPPDAPVRLRYDVAPVDACPLEPGSGQTFPEELHPNGNPSPETITPPEIPVPTEPDVAGLDACCAALVQVIYQNVQQTNAVAQQAQYVGDVLDKRLAEIQKVLGVEEGTDLLQELKKIREGVYHVDSNGVKYPLAKEILAVLNGLNIFFS